MSARLRAYVREHAPAGLSRPARAMLHVLAGKALDDGTFAGEHGGTISDDSWLAILPEWSRASIRRGRRELVDAGLVEVLTYTTRANVVRRSGTGRRGCQYRVLLVPGQAEQLPLAAGAEGWSGRPPRAPRVSKMSTQGAQIEHPLRARAHPPGAKNPSGTKKTPASASLPRTRRRPPQLVELDGPRKELADALWRRRLRAPCVLRPDELVLVDAVIARVGIPAMVQAAYDAYQAGDPPRSWRAWLGLWAGVQPRPDPPPRPAAAEPAAAGSAPRRTPADPLAVACPHPGCPAPAGQPCRDADLHERDPHQLRLAKAVDAGDGGDG